MAKKFINNMVFIAVLASLIDTPEANELATAAGAFRDILIGLGDLGIKVSIPELAPCEQGQLLLKWRFGGEKPDPKLMKEWTAEIVAAMTEIVNGKLL